MRLSHFASLVIVVAASACDVGTFGMAMGDDDGGIDDSMCKDRAPMPPAIHMHTAPVGGVGVNVSNAGESCVVASCHLASSPGSGAPPYQYGGTLYADSAATTPQAGAWVRVRDASGKAIETMTDQGGNFWFEGANMLAAPFPSQTSAAVCGVTAPGGVTKMSAALLTGQGSCNQGGNCHGTPTGSTAGTTKLFIQ